MEPKLLAKHLVRAVSVGESQAVLDALSYGAQPEPLTYEDQPLLHYALAKGFNDIAHALLMHGCDPNAKDPAGKTVLHYLCLTDKADMIACILQAGGNPNLKDTQQENSPLHIAASANKLDNIKVLLDFGAEVENLNKQQELPHQTAASKGHTDTCALLLTTRLNINHKNQDGFTALHLACKGGHVSCVTFLLGKGAKFSRSYHGETELMLATKGQSLQLIQILAEYGADVTLYNTKQQTCLHYAAKIQVQYINNYY